MHSIGRLTYSLQKSFRNSSSCDNILENKGDDGLICHKNKRRWSKDSLIYNQQTNQRFIITLTVKKLLKEVKQTYDENFVLFLLTLSFCPLKIWLLLHVQHRDVESLIVTEAKDLSDPAGECFSLHLITKLQTEHVLCIYSWRVHWAWSHSHIYMFTGHVWLMLCIIICLQEFTETDRYYRLKAMKRSVVRTFIVFESL